MSLWRANEHETLSKHFIHYDSLPGFPYYDLTSYIDRFSPFASRGRTEYLCRLGPSEPSPLPNIISYQYVQCSMCIAITHDLSFLYLVQHACNYYLYAINCVNYKRFFNQTLMSILCIINILPTLNLEKICV